MAKKSVICGEFIITINDNNSVSVSKIYKNTKEALREIASTNNFEISPNWTTNDLGRKILAQFCNSAKNGVIGEFQIEREANQRINVIKTFNNTIEGLRQCAKTINFKYDENWGTQTFGNKLVCYIESQK